MQDARTLGSTRYGGFYVLPKVKIAQNTRISGQVVHETGFLCTTFKVAACKVTCKVACKVAAANYLRHHANCTARFLVRISCPDFLFIEYFNVYLLNIELLWFAIHDQMALHTKHLIMENADFIYLNVKTVPALDPVTHETHTAYTVSVPFRNTLRVASGWTLQGAIELFAQQYSCDRASLRLKRPFSPQ